MHNHVCDFARVFRGWLTAIGLLVLSWNCPVQACDAAAGDIYSLTRVWQVHLELSADEFAAIQPRGGGGPFLAQSSTPPVPLDPSRELHRNDFGMDLPWGVGSVTIGDHRFPKVGIRYKGNGTIGDSSRSLKKSFKIDLDRAGGEERFGASKSINLHCGVTDPSKCRESLAYEIYRAAGVPAPRTALAEVRLTVPGQWDRELLGVYTLVEEVDKPYLRDRFGSDEGLLMKPERLRDFEFRGDDWSSYQEQYQPKRKPNKSEAGRILAFAQLVHSAEDSAFQAEIGKSLDIENYLRFLAATAYLSKSDRFFVIGHNYYLHLDAATHKLNFIPWDLDRAFANFFIFGSNAQQMDLSMTHPYADRHRLTERLLAIPSFRDRYQQLLSELSASAFESQRLLKLIQELENATREMIARENQARASRKEGAAVGGGPMTPSRPPELREFVEKRAQSLAAQISGTSPGYVPTGGFGGPPPIGQMLAGPLMQNYDANQDNSLSREEWMEVPKKIFNSCQPDTDGKCNLQALSAGITKMFPPPQEGAPPGPPVGGFLAGPIHTRADANRDGAITAEELNAAASSLFDEHDAEKVGRVNEELLAKMLTRLYSAPGRPPRAR